MQYLLDTHTLLWALFAPQKLPKGVRELLEVATTPVAISAVSFWEISMKFRLGKLLFDEFDPQTLPEVCQHLQVKVLPLTGAEAASCHLLQADYHRDPFDRMLIHQAIMNGWVLVSGDKSIAQYASEGLKIFWK